MSNAVFGYWTMSYTLNFNFRARTTQGSGPVTTMVNAFPSCDLIDLSILVADGSTGPLSQSTIVETVVTHVMNSNLLSFWSPPQGQTCREYLTKELSEYLEIPVLSSGTSRYCKLIFDGQFGPLALAAA